MATFTLHRGSAARSTEDDDADLALAKLRNVVVIPAPRALVVGSRGEFRDHVRQRLSEKPAGLVVDCARSEYIDSSGLGTLFSLAKEAKRLGVGYSIARLAEDLRLLLTLTRIDAVMCVADTLRTGIVVASEFVEPGEIDVASVIDAEPDVQPKRLRLEP